MTAQQNRRQEGTRDMTPQQLRMIYPKSPQTPTAAITLVVMAYALWPMFIACAAIGGAHESLIEGKQ